MKITFRHANRIECFEDISEEFAEKVSMAIDSLEEGIWLPNYKDIGGEFFISKEELRRRVHFLEDNEFANSSKFGYDSDLLECLLMELLR